MRTAFKVAIAGAAGVALLTGGAGTLAFWTDTQTGSSVVISSGDLTLGSITDSTGWFIQQNASGVSPAEATPVAFTAGMLVVPGDVLTKTVAVPVSISGKNNKATLAVSAAATPPNALTSAAVVAVESVNGVAASTATLTPVNNGTVNVKFSVTIPWTATNATKSLTTNFQAQYTLTQIPVATP
jgi:alternate signal-mediated exported protein